MFFFNIFSRQNGRSFSRLYFYHKRRSRFLRHIPEDIWLRPKKKEKIRFVDIPWNYLVAITLLNKRIFHFQPLKRIRVVFF